MRPCDDLQAYVALPPAGPLQHPAHPVGLGRTEETTRSAHLVFVDAQHTRQSSASIRISDTTAPARTPSGKRQHDRRRTVCGTPYKRGYPGLHNRQLHTWLMSDTVAPPTRARPLLHACDARSSMPQTRIHKWSTRNPCHTHDMRQGGHGNTARHNMHKRPTVADRSPRWSIARREASLSPTAG